MKNFFLCILAIISLECFAGNFTYAAGSQVNRIRSKGYWYEGSDIDNILRKFHKDKDVTITRSMFFEYKCQGFFGEVGNILEKCQLDTHRTVAIPLNVGNHWIGVILRGGKAYVLDSCGGSRNYYKQKIRKFLKEFKISKDIDIIALDDVALQKDGSSCGAYTIENIMAFLRGKKARRNAQAMRNYHARILESEGEIERVEWVEGEEWEVDTERSNTQLSSPSYQTKNTINELGKIGKKSDDVQQYQTLQQNQQEVINAVNNIPTMLNTVMQPFINDRVAEVVTVNMNENDNNPKVVASGGKINDLNIAPKSCDIWARGYIGTINQGATNNSTNTAATNLYGITIGVDKLLNSNSTLFGVALSYTQFNTKHKTQQSSTTKELKENHYQANIYMHYSPTNYFFLEMIGGLGVYGNNTKIQNIFSLSQDHVFGYHGCATIGYSFFPIERIAFTPTLKLLYYNIYIPDSSFCNNKSSNFSTLGRMDSSIGIAIKLLEVNNNVNDNFVVIPEGTVAFKFRLHDSVNGVYADQLKLLTVASTSYDDLSANVLASPRQLLQLGAKLSLSTQNVSICLFGNIEIAKKYLAGMCGINLQLSF